MSINTTIKCFMGFHKPVLSHKVGLYINNIYDCTVYSYECSHCTHTWQKLGRELEEVRTFYEPSKLMKRK